ncbi:hypothetical protein HAX54_000193 [Datura stramonium]|uniref:Uncharacterized protein n=1 Tax=Datura stramonium TaxID=4076 RepID=A0ABS8WTM8_DATST|nr:hypothetical protein [Datura stramonium]
MAKLDGEDDEEVNFLDIQKNLKNYSQKELRILANVLIDAYHGIINEKDMLAADLEESEEVRSALLVRSQGHGGSANSQSTGQEPGTPSCSSNEEHQWDPLVNNPENSKIEGLRDEGVPDITNPRWNSHSIGTCRGCIPIPEDDNVPLNLVFSRKPRMSSKSSSKLKKGTKGGPVTRDTSKQSTVEETPEVERSQLQRNQKKPVVEGSSKGKGTVSKEPGVSVSRPSLDAHVGERVEIIMKQKVLEDPPMPVMYENEVSDFYSILLFTDDEKTNFSTMGGVEILFNSISLRKTLDVPFEGEFTVKDKLAS